MHANVKITVKYLPPTNTLGSRYRVSSDNVTALPDRTVSRDHGLHHDDQVDALIDQRIQALIAAKTERVKTQYSVAGSGIEADRLVVKATEVVTFAEQGVTTALLRLTVEVRQ